MTRNSSRRTTWECMKGFTLVKNHLSATTVTWLLYRMTTWECMKGFTLVKNHSSATCDKHTIPVFEQLPLLFGQLKKQSGRSILFFLSHKMTTPMFCVLALLFSFWRKFCLHHKQNLGVVILWKRKKSSDTASETDPQTGKVWIWPEGQTQKACK